MLSPHRESSQPVVLQGLKVLLVALAYCPLPRRPNSVMPSKGTSAVAGGGHSQSNLPEGRTQHKPGCFLAGNGWPVAVPSDPLPSAPLQPESPCSAVCVVHLGSRGLLCHLGSLDSARPVWDETRNHPQNTDEAQALQLSVRAVGCTGHSCPWRLRILKGSESPPVFSLRGEGGRGMHSGVPMGLPSLGN